MTRTETIVPMAITSNAASRMANSRSLNMVLTRFAILPYTIVAARAIKNIAVGRATSNGIAPSITGVRDLCFGFSLL